MSVYLTVTTKKLLAILIYTGTMNSGAALASRIAGSRYSKVSK